MKKILIILILFCLYSCSKKVDILQPLDKNIWWPYKDTLKIDSTLSRYPVRIDTLK